MSWTACLPLLALLSAALPARGAEPGPRNALSLHPFSLGAHGVALQYERYVAPRHWSVALGLGFRSSSRDDYSSYVTSVGVEPRYWLGGKYRSSLGADAMVGPFLSARFDAAWLAMSDTRRDAWVGGSLGLSLVGGFGWRFAIGHLELTPSIGLGSRTDFDVSGRLAPWSRGVLRLDFTAGWMF